MSPSPLACTYGQKKFITVILLSALDSEVIGCKAGFWRLFGELLWIDSMASEVNMLQIVRHIPLKFSWMEIFFKMRSTHCLKPMVFMPYFLQFIKSKSFYYPVFCRIKLASEDWFALCVACHHSQRSGVCFVLTVMHKLWSPFSLYKLNVTMAVSETISK